jgi:phosphoribosylformylglycinamidine synthase PurS subunit
LVKVIVTVRLKPGVLDPQGLAVMKGLQALGYEEVSDVRFGKHIEMLLDVNEDDRQSIKQSVEAMCQELLANPVIEEYTFETVEGEI